MIYCLNKMISLSKTYISKSEKNQIITILKNNKNKYDYYSDNDDYYNEFKNGERFFKKNKKIKNKRLFRFHGEKYFIDKNSIIYHYIDPNVAIGWFDIRDYQIYEFLRTKININNNIYYYDEDDFNIYDNEYSMNEVGYFNNDLNKYILY